MGKCTSLVQVVHKFSLTHLTIFLYDDNTAKDASLPSSRADSARACNKVVPTDPPTFQCRRNMSWEKYDSGTHHKCAKQERAGDRDEEE